MLIEKNIVGSVAYVGRNAVHESVLWSWVTFVQYCNEFLLQPGQIINWMRGNNSGQYMCRNYLATMMLGDWILMIDSDHTFDPDILHRMLRIFQNDDLDILTGLYQYKDPPYHLVLYKWIEDVGQYRHIVKCEVGSPTQAFQIDCAGAGTLLVRRRVFEKIANELGEKPFDPIDQYGEDFSFFDRCRRLGIKAWCCPSIQSYHLRTQETRIEEYNPAAMHTLSRLQVPAIQ